MASPSKEEKILELILENSPLKHWHFEEFLRITDITRGALNKWLNRYLDEGLLFKVKEKGKFPYLSVGNDNPVYYAKKRQYMLDKLYGSGLIKYLMALDAKTIIIFGSIIKGDWYKGSDIDVFVLGSKNKIEKHKYELDIQKDIEIHSFSSIDEVKEVKTGLVKNIIDGYVVKGSVKDIIGVV